MKILTVDRLRQHLLQLCPTGSMGEDNNGQLIFYTAQYRCLDPQCPNLAKEDHLCPVCFAKVQINPK